MSQFDGIITNDFNECISVRREIVPKHLQIVD